MEKVVKHETTSWEGKLLQYNKREIIILALCVLFFESLNYPLIKIALNDVSPFLFLSIRFWLLALVFMPFAQKKNVNLLPLLQFAIIFNVAHYGFNYLSFKYLSPTIIALFQYLQVPFLFMMFYKKMFILLPFILYAILRTGDFNSVSLIGCILAIFSNLFWALAQMVQKKEEYSISTFVFFTSLFSAPFLSILAILTQESFDLSANSHPEKIILLLIYQIVVLGICKGLWANLSFKEGKNISTSFIWILKPICVAALSFFLCV